MGNDSDQAPDGREAAKDDGEEARSAYRYMSRKFEVIEDMARIVRTMAESNGWQVVTERTTAS